jgi:hypothetical protein
VVTLRCEKALVWVFGCVCARFTLFRASQDIKNIRIHGVFSREITIHTVIYGSYQLWCVSNFNWGWGGNFGAAFVGVKRRVGCVSAMSKKSVIVLRAKEMGYVCVC